MSSDTSSDTSPVQTGKNNKELHKEVLGGIVTANGFFTGAVFLSVTGTVTPLSGIPSNCIAGDDISLNLFVFQVWSLGFYFLSSLIATAMKLVVIYYDTDPIVKKEGTTYLMHSAFSADQGKLAKLLAPYLRFLMIFSVVSSAVGSSLLLLSVMDLVQIKLGLLSCGSTLVVISVLGISGLMVLGLGVYLLISWYFLKYVF